VKSVRKMSFLKEKIGAKILRQINLGSEIMEVIIGITLVCSCIAMLSVSFMAIVFGVRMIKSKDF
jgi:hypothetical protein